MMTAILNSLRLTIHFRKSPQAIKAETSPFSMDRDLQIADWGVSIGIVDGQNFTFSIAEGGGTDAKVIVRVYDRCRREAGNQTSVGYFFGGVGTAVTGVAATPTPTSIEPNSTSSIAINFVEGIAQNTVIYTDVTSTTAKVKMCVEIGLYDNEEANLVNFAEIDLEYTIDLTTNFTALTGYAATQSNQFSNPDEAAVTLDGILEAYFCDKANPLVTLIQANSQINNQGTEVSVCFQIPDGQFEVKDINNLNLIDTGGTQGLQTIISNNIEQTGTGLTPLAVSVTTDTSNTDTNVIVVSFLLYANFFDSTELTLGGTGEVMLEFGGASASDTRYLRKVDLRILQQKKASTEPFSIAEHDFIIEGAGPSSAYTSLASSVVVVGASFVAAKTILHFFLRKHARHC
jgi:hypothetical protein